MAVATADAFSVQPIASKDLGIVARRELVEGETLLREEPLLRLTPDGEGRFDGRYGLNGDRERCRELLTSLSQHATGKRGAEAGVFERVIETNGFVGARSHALKPRLFRALFFGLNVRLASVCTLACSLCFVYSRGRRRDGGLPHHLAVESRLRRERAHALGPCRLRGLYHLQANHCTRHGGHSQLWCFWRGG